MKKNQMIAKTLVVSMLLLGGAVSANAQFGGLKGLAKKAKDAAKDKVEQKIDNAKIDAVSVGLVRRVNWAMSGPRTSCLMATANLQLIRYRWVPT